MTRKHVCQEQHWSRRKWGRQMEIIFTVAPIWRKLAASTSAIQTLVAVPSTLSVWGLIVSCYRVCGPHWTIRVGWATSRETNRHHFCWPICEWCVGQWEEQLMGLSVASVMRAHFSGWHRLASPMLIVPSSGIRSFLTFHFLFYMWLSKIQAYFPTSSPPS